MKGHTILYELYYSKIYKPLDYPSPFLMKYNVPKIKHPKVSKIPLIAYFLKFQSP